MASSSSSSTLFPWALFFFFPFLFLILNSSFPSMALISMNNNNITLLGDAEFKELGRISLTQQDSSSSIGVGRAIYSNPIRFLNPTTNSTASFTSRFSFFISPSSSSSSSSFGDGLTFLITSNPRTFSNSVGYMGLPNENIQESFIAIEFDTSFDPFLEDISDNHIGIDINSVISFASVDSTSMGFDLKNGKLSTVWIEYLDSKKMIKVWISYSRSRSIRPILATHIDLSMYFKEFMYVGFSASNGKGSEALHIVEKWRFRTFGMIPSVTPFDTREEGGCFMCNDSENGYVDFRSKRRNRTELVLGFGGAAFFFLVAVIVGIISWYRIRKKGSHDRRRTEADQNLCRTELNQVPKRLSLSEIKSATRGFHRSKIIGEGGSGIVYGGCLASGKEVAIKRFSRINNTDPFNDPFANELAAMIGCLKHKNLLQLQGWCSEEDELVLVYEYMPNGNLNKFLHRASDSPTVLKWEDRLKIVLGVASALTYLHEECEKQIIHRDVKACNVMLDDEFNAKLGDFGLAELYERSSSAREATIPAGTMGCVAPEYVHSGVPTEKSDVYSFGVMVLEVATGRRPVEDDGVILVDWVWNKWSKGKLIEAADYRLSRFDKREMERMLMVGLSCVHPNCIERPTVKEAARVLKGEAPLPVLPARKPVVRLVSHLPDDTEELLRPREGISNGNQNICYSDPPWLTPKSTFS